MKILLLFALFISTGVLFAQTNFTPGYVITNSGDSLFGEIDYRGDLLMSSVCEFRAADKTITTFKPSEIYAFRFYNSKYFVSREVNGSSVFLEYLIKGKISIYYFRDINGDHYYLEKDSLSLVELPFEEGIKYIGDQSMFFSSKKHIGVLTYYMKDAPELKPLINKVYKPEHLSLIKLAEDYHNIVCSSEECIIFEKKHPILKVNPEVFAGLIHYSRDFTEIENKLFFQTGILAHVWLPRMNEKFFFKTGLIYTSVTESMNDYNIFKVPVKLEYMYPGKKLKPKFSYGNNLWLLSFEGNTELSYTTCFETGLNYKIGKSLYLSGNFNTEFTSIMEALLDSNGIDFVSSSFDLGLNFEF